MAGRAVYQPKDWNNGETITEAALDHIEQGIFNADNEIVQARGSFSTLENRLLELEYFPIEIESFKIQLPVNGIAEKGSTSINRVGFKWTLNKPATSISLNGNEVSPTYDQFVLDGIVLDTTQYTLSVEDEGRPSTGLSTNVTKEISLYFYNRIYYGTDFIPTGDINSTFVTSLEWNILSDTKTRTINLTTSSNRYMWYAVPTRLGYCNFKVGGFEGGFEPPVTVNVTNSSNFTESYYVYRSTNANLGSTSVQIT